MFIKWDMQKYNTPCRWILLLIRYSNFTKMIMDATFEPFDLQYFNLQFWKWEIISSQNQAKPVGLVGLPIPAPLLSVRKILTLPLVLHLRALSLGT